MLQVHSRLVVVLCLGACVLPSGCGKSHGWSVMGGLESSFRVEQLRCDGRIFLVLVANGCSDGTSSGEGNGSFHGEFVTLDGRRITWSCSTSDAARGTVTIDGQKFDLGDGAVFLVRTNEPKASVQQHPVEMSKLQNPLTPDRPLQEWGTAEPRIAEFVNEAETKP